MTQTNPPPNLPARFITDHFKKHPARDIITYHDVINKKFEWTLLTVTIAILSLL